MVQMRAACVQTERTWTSQLAPPASSVHIWPPLFGVRCTSRTALVLQDIPDPVGAHVSYVSRASTRTHLAPLSAFFVLRANIQTISGWRIVAIVRLENTVSREAWQTKVCVQVFLYLFGLALLNSRAQTHTTYAYRFLLVFVRVFIFACVCVCVCACENVCVCLRRFKVHSVLSNRPQ